MLLTYASSLVVHTDIVIALGPDLRNILRQSDDYLNAKVTQLTKYHTKGARLFLGTIHLQNRKIV